MTQIDSRSGIGQQSTTQRLIFTVTTGRSGTGLLAALVGTLPETIAFHEPEPSFDLVMRDVQSDPQLARQFWEERKLPAIRSYSDRVYVETSHLFGKGFFEPLLGLGLLPDLIFLDRDPRDVALSNYQLGAIPGRTALGLRFLLSPNDPGVLSLADWRSLHDYQLCYWYCLETARRASLYKARVAQVGGRFAETNIARFTTVQGFLDLINKLALPRPGVRGWLAYLKMRHRRINSKLNRKKQLDERIDFDSLETEVLKLVGTTTDAQTGQRVYTSGQR